MADLSVYRRMKLNTNASITGQRALDNHDNNANVYQKTKGNIYINQHQICYLTKSTEFDSNQTEEIRTDRLRAEKRRREMIAII